MYAGLAIVATVAAYLFMDNLSSAKSSPREQLKVVRNRQTWVMSFLYIGTFGSFIGYSAAMPLLIKLNFWVPDPAPLGTGIFFAYYAFLGAGIGSLTRPLGGWLADKYGGARVTLGAFVGDDRVHARGAVDPHPAHAQPDRRRRDRHGQRVLVPVVPRLLPVHLRRDRHRQRVDVQDDPGDLPDRGRARHDAEHLRATAALDAATKQSSAAIGVIGAVGALGGFLIPLAFSSPWVDDPLSATKGAFVVFTCFYVVCAVVTYAVYLRRTVSATSLARAGI